MKKYKKPLRVLLQLLLLLALIVVVNMWRGRDAASGAAPLLSAATLDGAHFDLRTQHGRPLFVHFWAEWCPVCAFEQDTVEALSRDYQVITVAMSSGSDEALRAYMREHGLGFPVINDQQGQIAAAWGVAAVPATFVIDAGGEIRFVEVGYTTRLGLIARHWLAEYL
jgi:peroxiredoxin